MKNTSGILLVVLGLLIGLVGVSVLLIQPAAASPGRDSWFKQFLCIRTVEETYNYANWLARKYPDLAEWVLVGTTGEGRQMYVLHLTNQRDSDINNRPLLIEIGNRPELFVISSIHAREYAPAELNTRFAEYLLRNYGVNADVTWLLDHHDIRLLLQANPDGRKKAELYESRYWRKNTHDLGNCTKPWDVSMGSNNYPGVDLNRNFSIHWLQTYGPCFDAFQGEEYFSEPETIAIRDQIDDIFADYRDEDNGDDQPADPNTRGVFIDLHSYSGYVGWPWGYLPDPDPDDPSDYPYETVDNAQFQTFGRKLAAINDYMPLSGEGYRQTVGSVQGNSTDYAYGIKGIAALFFEVGEAKNYNTNPFFPTCEHFLDIIVPDNIPALIYAAKAAGAPYITPSGPDVFDIELVPNPIAKGGVTKLTATVSDERFSNKNGTEPTQKIVAVEYSIDVPPWDPGYASSRVRLPEPEDVSWDEKNEEIAVDIDTGDISPGLHTIYLRAQDDDGEEKGVWGAVSSIFLWIGQRTDIYTKDNENDDGTSPTQSVYHSPDIWTCTDKDCDKPPLGEEQNIVKGTDNYIKVDLHRVPGSNKETAAGRLELYYTAAGGDAEWNEYSLGDWTFIGSAEVKIDPDSDSDTAEIVWQADRIPEDENEHYCFLTRWISHSDPMTTLEGDRTIDNARKNNNISWRNFAVINFTTTKQIGTFYYWIRNVEPGSVFTDLEFRVSLGDPNSGDGLYFPGTITVTLDENIPDGWSVEGFDIIEDKQLRLTGQQGAWIRGIQMPEDVDYKITVSINQYFANVLYVNRDYRFDIVQHTQRLDKTGFPMEERSGVAYDLRLLEQVNLDIRPETPLNRINPSMAGFIPVAILGRADFDVYQINVGSLRLGVDGKMAAPQPAHAYKDLNGDGRLDLLLNFWKPNFGIDPATPVGTMMYLKITGRLNNTYHIEGRDFVIIWNGVP